MEDVTTPVADVLIVAPHVDDEVLGCFSFLDEQAVVLHLGVEDRPEVSREHRLEEVAAAAAVAGFAWRALDFEVNRYRSADLISALEGAIERWRPATLLVPEPSYNQDHRAAYDAAIVATRPHDRKWFVNNVLLYEQPHSVLWKHGGEHEPTLFRPIEIAQKLELYALYRSQVRGHRSPQIVEALARLRGAQANAAFAEGFHVKRLIGGIR